MRLLFTNERTFENFFDQIRKIVVVGLLSGVLANIITTSVVVVAVGVITITIGGGGV